MWDYFQEDDGYCLKTNVNNNVKVKSKKNKYNKIKYVFQIFLLILFLTAIIMFPIFNYCCSIFLFFVLLRIIVIGKKGLKKDINLISNMIGR